MKYFDSIRLRTRYRVLALPAICVVINLVQWGNTQPLLSPPAVPASIKQSGRSAAALKMAVQNTKANFEPSLTAMEETDFLITPALILQEAISADVIITYPIQ
jgi:hypothetical protein